MSSMGASSSPLRLITRRLSSAAATVIVTPSRCCGGGVSGRVGAGRRWLATAPAPAPAQAAAALPPPPELAQRMRVEDWSYELPEDRIAQWPAVPRDTARLLVVLPPEHVSADDDRGDGGRTASAPAAARSARQQVADYVRQHCASAAQGATRSASAQLNDFHCSSLGALIPPQAHLVLNESRVFPARMLAARPQDSAPVEVMFLSPEASDQIPSALLRDSCTGQRWRAMVRAGDARSGDEFTVCR
jgi:hypothetical protein